MLVNASDIKGLTIRATDGDIGTVEELYFDDESWAVRYLTVETGGWLGGRRVLISPFAILRTDWDGRFLEVALTKQQVEDSPDIDTHLPVSRQHEAGYLGYYGYPNYWAGPFLWGPAATPVGFAVPQVAFADAMADRVDTASPDSHLRMTQEVTSYHIEATDGEIGHVDTFIVDDQIWAIRYVEIATRNWWPGKKVLLSPTWIEKVSWDHSMVKVALSREAIQTAPEYDEDIPISREYENKLYLHYGQPPYWLNETQEPANFTLTK